MVLVPKLFKPCRLISFAVNNNGEGWFSGFDQMGYSTDYPWYRSWMSEDKIVI